MLGIRGNRSESMMVRPFSDDLSVGACLFVSVRQALFCGRPRRPRLFFRAWCNAAGPVLPRAEGGI